MRKITLFLMLTFSVPAFSQVFLSKDGVTKFSSEAPLEVIKAETNKTSGAVDCGARTFAFSVDLTTFQGFNSALQKEHFLENYMEADKYPKVVFKGKIIEDIDFSKKGVTTVRAKGIFSVHGVDIEKIVKVKITVKDKEIIVESNFEVPLEDHNIKIPKVVNQKIAPVIQVEVRALLKPKS